MNIVKKIKHSLFKYPTLRRVLGFVPYVNRLVFMKHREIVSRELSNGVVEMYDGLPLSDVEYEFIVYGRYLRNNYLLWHPRNPYTVRLWDGSGDCPYHPDNYSDYVVSEIKARIKLRNL